MTTNSNNALLDKLDWRAFSCSHMGQNAAFDDEVAMIAQSFGASITHSTPALYHHTCQKWPYILYLARGSVCDHCGRRVGIDSAIELVAGEMTHTMTEVGNGPKP